MILREVLDVAAQDTPDAVRAVGPDGSTSWTVRDIVFAIASPDGATASFLLDPIVAGAAARTPDVTRSSRGPGWVDLHPAAVDGHAADRARAWFLSGYRRLTGPGA